MVECTGCGQDFSVKGYAHHVHTTSHLPCLTVYNEEVMRILANLHNAGMSMVDEGGPDDALPPNNEALNSDDDSETEESNTQLNNDDMDIMDEMRELPHLPDEYGQATPDGHERDPQGQPSRAPEPNAVTNGD
jgi:hypothetical protein